MSGDELEEAKRQRDGFQQRLQLMRDGKMKTTMDQNPEIDTTRESIKLAEQSLAALERKIARLENDNAHRP